MKNSGIPIRRIENEPEFAAEFQPDPFSEEPHTLPHSMKYRGKEENKRNIKKMEENQS